MSAAPQRGRRRAESVRRASFLGSAFAPAPAHSGRRAAHAALGSEAVPAARKAVSGTAKCVAALAVVGALVAAGAVAQDVIKPGGPSLTSLVEANTGAAQVGAAQATTAPAVTAPTDAAIAFSGLSVTSSASTSATPTSDPVKAEADAVKPEAAPAPAPAPAAPAAVDDPAGAKAFAASQLASFGWGEDQMSCLTQLWERESNWRTSAENPSSGAYGIAQSLPATKMESVGGDWATNYQTQIRWGLGYIQGRYGSPCGAWGHSNAVGWY